MSQQEVRQRTRDRCSTPSDLASDIDSAFESDTDSVGVNDPPKLSGNAAGRSATDGLKDATQVLHRAWDSYRQHEDVAEVPIIKPLSSHWDSREFVYLLQDGTWDSVAFLQCLHKEQARGKARAEPESARAIRVTIVLSAVHKVDILEMGRQSIQQVRANPLYRFLLLLLALLVVWWALRSSSFDHPPWTVVPLRWVAEAWRGSSSS